MVYANETARVTKSTASGTSYIELTVFPFGGTDKALVCVPTAKADGTPSVLAMAAHGSGGNEQQINIDRMLSTRDGWLDRGWIVASAFAHDRAWASNAALTDFTNVHAWVNAIWPVTDTMLHGESMGGLTMMVLASKHLIPTVRAAVSIDGALNLRSAYDNTGQTYGTQIKAAYGIATDGSDYAAKTAGHDAVLLDMTTFNGLHLFVEGSPNDAHIPKTQNADVFVANLGNNAARLVTKTGTGTHVTAENFFPTDVLAFMDTALPVPAWPAPVPLPPNVSTVELYTVIGGQLVKLIP